MMKGILRLIFLGAVVCGIRISANEGKSFSPPIDIVEQVTEPALSSELVYLKAVIEHFNKRDEEKAYKTMQVKAKQWNNQELSRTSSPPINTSMSILKNLKDSNESQMSAEVIQKLQHKKEQYDARRVKLEQHQKQEEDEELLHMQLWSSIPEYLHTFRDVGFIDVLTHTNVEVTATHVHDKDSVIYYWQMPETGSSSSMIYSMLIAKDRLQAPKQKVRLIDR